MGKAVREGHLSIEEGNTMIVFDSSTLILLAKKELLDMFLHNFNGVVAIPKEVTKESCTKKTLDVLLIEKRIENGEINVYEIEKEKALMKLDNLKKVGRYKRDIIEDAKRRVVEWEV